MFTGDLFPFQKSAVDRMVDRRKMLVAYEQGTGKTVMTIAAIEHLMDLEIILRPVLVVALSSLKYQWAAEIEKFSDSTPLVIDGTPKQRGTQYTQTFEFGTTGVDYVIVNYEQVVNDWEYVGAMGWGAIVADEATALKGFRSKRSKAVKKLGKDTQVKFALTGTPIENGKPEELFCADEETQVLSQRGWLSYTELTTQDLVLTLNHETGRSEWQMVRAVNVFPVQDQEMVLMKHRDHSSLTTPTHRWPVVRRSYKDGARTDDQRVWTTTETLKRRDFVPVAVPCSDLPTRPTHSDALVELVAWVYTEGHIRRLRDGSPGTAVNIAQNEGDSKRRAAEALFDLFGEESPSFPRLGGRGDSVPRWRSDHSGFKLNTVAGALLLSHAPGKVPSHEFLLSLTAAQLDLFIEVSMLADNNGAHHFSQKNPAHAEAFQFACTLAGIGTSIRSHNKVDCDRGGNPYQMTAVTKRRREFFGPVYAEKTPVRHTGHVWCPTTPNGSWFARREGTTYFTGNSIMQFVDPTVLGKFDLFDKTFIVRNQWGWVDRYRNLPTLSKTMSDVMVRKRQTDPDVQEYMPLLRRKPPVLVTLDHRTKRLYERIRVDLLRSLDDAAEVLGASGFSLDSHYGMAPSPNDPAGAVKGKIMAQITALRMCSGNADLIRQSAVQFKESMTSGAATMKGSSYAAELHDEGLLHDLPKTPLKAKKVVEFVTDFLVIDPAHKVVIFSSFLGTVDLLQSMLGDQAVRYTGTMNAKAKEEARQYFKTRDDIRVLISSDAGGYGVDLPEGNLLVNYDLPWKAGTASQRDSRIIRASSEWEHVTVVNFLVSDSIEVRQYEMLQQKHRVAEAVVDGKWINDKGGVDLTLGTLREFLSHP